MIDKDCSDCERSDGAAVLESDSHEPIPSTSTATANAETPPKKKRRICVFRDEWLKDLEFKEWLDRDTKNIHNDPSLARCRICCCSFSIKTDGLTAVRKHAGGDKHKRNCQSQKMSSTLKQFFSPPNTVEQEQITASELAMTFHGIQHHHSYSSQNCGNKLFCKVFSNSKLSKKISCGKTKALKIFCRLIQSS